MPQALFCFGTRNEFVVTFQHTIVGADVDVAVDVNVVGGVYVRRAVAMAF